MKMSLKKIEVLYCQIARELLNNIESDHLLSILLETPCDIKQLSILDICLANNMIEFFDFYRLSPIFKHMWIEFEYLDPSHKFTKNDIKFYDILGKIFFKPAQFYFSPIGRYIISSIFYVFYVIMFTIYVAHREYLFKSEHKVLEYMLWVLNVGYILFEFMEIYITGSKYFQEWLNYFDILIILNWMGIALLRFFIWPTYHENEQTRYDAVTNPIARDYAGDVLNQDSVPCLIYMCLWIFQCILIWSRMLSIFQRSETIAPIMKTIVYMIKDIVNFTIILVIILAGWIFALFYLADDDLDTFELSSSFWNSALYMYQTLLGEQNWDDVHPTRPEDIPTDDRIATATKNVFYFGRNRSIMAQVIISLFAILGTILLLNLLIALMANTYNYYGWTSNIQVNFDRIQHTIQLNNSLALMPPPFNIIVLLLALLFMILEFIVSFITCGYYSISINIISPIVYNPRMKLYQSMPKRKRKYKSRSPSKSRLSHHSNRDKSSNNIEYSNNIKNNDTTDDENDKNNNDYDGLNSDTCCFIFQKNHQRKCCSLLCQNNFESKRFCRYCRNDMKDDKGNIRDYFDLYGQYRLLDEQDKELMIELLRDVDICYYCFRPYKTKYRINNITKEPSIDSSRYDHFQVTLEIISYYFFKILWLPIVMFIALPAFISYVFTNLNNNDSNKYTNYNAKQSRMDIYYENMISKFYKKSNRNFINDVIHDNISNDDSLIHNQQKNDTNTSLKSSHNSNSNIAGQTNNNINNDYMESLLDDFKATMIDVKRNQEMLLNEINDLKVKCNDIKASNINRNDNNNDNQTSNNNINARQARQTLTPTQITAATSAIIDDELLDDVINDINDLDIQ